MSENPCNERDNAGQTFCVALAKDGKSKCTVHAKYHRLHPRELTRAERVEMEVNAGS